MKLKRIMAMVLCVAMVLSTMSFSVFAEEQTDVSVTNVDINEANPDASQDSDEMVIPITEQTVENSINDISDETEHWYDAEATELIISTVGELQEFALITQGTHQTIEKDSFAGKTVKLGDDIDLKDTHWYYRNTEGTVEADYRIVDFAGTFDGNNKTIKNISLQNEHDSGTSVGLCFFRSVTGAITNLTLDGIDADSVGNATFYAINSTMNNAGGYNTENVHVKNVDVYIDNDECAEDTYSQVAGMIRWHGGNGGSGPECRSKDCSVTNLHATVTGEAAVGGFSVFVAQRSWFDNCDVTDVTFEIGSVEYGAGGFGAQVQSSSYVQRVFNDCDVTNVNITVGYLDAMVGGFLGNLGGMVDCDYCDVTGEITILSDVENAHAGGFVGDLGWQGDWSSDKKGHTFDNCSADVDIAAVNSDVGGFVGMSAIVDDTVLDQDEAFSAVFNSCSASGDVATENGAAGGFVGSGDRGEYASCTATGSVKGDIAGGFWGEVFPMPAAPANGNTGKGDDFTGVVLNSNIVSEDVEGTTYEAGLIGYMNISDDGGYTTPTNFENNSSNDINKPAKTYFVASKAELDTAIAEAQDGETIKLTADINVGASPYEIYKGITLNLGGFTLTTEGAYGGLLLKNGPSVINGSLVHTGKVAAIKAFKVDAIEDLVIEVTYAGGDKTIGGIVVQNKDGKYIKSIKNVTIKGVGLTNGIETYECGDEECVIGSMENVTIDAVKTGMLISAPCGTATNCNIKGAVSGIEIWIKGTYSASLDLVNCKVEGGQQAVYAHDEFNDNPNTVNNGTIKLTADDETSFTSDGVKLTKVINHIKESQITLPEAIVPVYVAKVGNKSYESFVKAVEEANAVAEGATIELLKDVTLGETLEITGNVTISGEYTITRADNYTGTLFAVSAEATLTLDGGLVVDGGNAWNYIKDPLEMDMANGNGTYVGNHITPAEGGVNATAHLIENNGTLNANKVTIENSYSTNGVSAINCGTNSATILNGAVMQKIAANRSGAVVYVGGADAVLTITGETKITGNFGIGNGGIIQNYGQGTTVNMEGGSIDNNHIGKSGTLYASYSGNANKINTFNMSGGIITKNIMEGYGPVYIHTNTVWNMTGGEISNNTSFLPTYVRSNNNAGSISGGKIVNNEITGTHYSNGYYVTRPDIYLGTGSQITGGTFTQDVTEYLAPDYGLVYDETTGTYSLTQELYEYNGVAYKTFAEVIENIKSAPATLADEDKTPVVKVLATHRPSETIAIDTNIVMDLNGKSLLGVTGVNPIIRVLADVTITGNGMIDSANQGDGYCFIVGSSDGSVAGNLTIENGTFKGTTTAVSVTKGTATILDGDFRVKPYQVDGQDDNYNFLLNCIDANYKDGSAKIIVKGGKFTKFNPADNAAEGANTSFVAPGHMAVDNDDETWNVIGMVAMIGETGFATLAEAIKTAQANDTIVLLANITEDVTVNKSITIDGGNFKYTGNISVSGTTSAVTVKNVNFVNGTGYAITTNRIKSITIENCTVTNYAWGFLYANKSTPTVVVKNVTVDGGNYGFHWVYGTSATLENVTMTNVANGLYIQNYAGKIVTLKNCNITSINVWEKATGVQTFKFEGANTVATLSASQYAKYVLAAVDATLTAPEGSDVTTDLEGYFVKNVDGTYNVAEKVAQIGDNYYGSLQEAIDSAPDNATITLVKDIANGTGVKVNSGKNFTLDLGGFTYTIASNPVGSKGTETNGFQLLQKSDITIKNGTITSVVGSDVKLLVMNYANLTLDRVTLDGKNLEDVTKAGGYVLSNNNGTTVIKDSTITAPTGGVAFDVDYQSSYKEGVKVSLEGNTTIRGAIEYEDNTNNELTKDATLEVDAPVGYEWKTVGSVSKLFKKATPATVKAFAETSTVKAGDKVVVQVIAEGLDFTNGDWELRYDPTMFELNANATTYYEDAAKGVKAQAVNSADANTLVGEVITVGGTLQQGNVIPSETVLATYTFTVLPQNKDTVSSKFDIVNAHINTCDYADSQTNVPAVPVDFDIIITREGRVITGTLEVANNLTYNGDIQKGNAFVVSDTVVGKENAVITYSTKENGIYTTELPTFKEAGSYSIWVKVNVDGYAEYKAEHDYMVIGEKDITLSLEVAAGAAYQKVDVKPVITGVYDTEFKGTLTISGVEGTYTKNDFIYMGNGLAIAKEARTMSVNAGSNEVTITYTQGATDNYATATATKTVEADKAFATQAIVDKLNAAADAAVTYTYNGTEHKAQDEIDAPEGWSVTVTRISDGTANPGVTNVADKEFVEIRFTHSNYNDVVISRVLKVEPLALTIIVPDFEKGAGEPDDFTTKSVTYSSNKFVASAEFTTIDELVATGNLNLVIVRKTFGEEDGIYDLTATYTPNDNYDIFVNDGKLTIGMPSDTKIEVVNNKVNGNGNSSADYVAGYKLVLVYTNTATARYTYDDKQMFDLSNAGYEYFDNSKTIAEQTDDNYKYVYGIIVKAESNAADEYYADKVDFIGTNKYKPEKIVYDADINYDDKFTNNDTSAANNVLNVENELSSFTMYYFLKADYDRTAEGEHKSDKMVKLFDVQEVQKFINTKTTIQ